MTKQTEKLEQELIDAVIEDERQSSGEPEKKLGKLVIERTDVAQLQGDWSDWE